MFRRKISRKRRLSSYAGKDSSAFGEKGEGFRENYADGDTFDRTGLTVTAYWNDGYVEVVDSVKYAVVPSIITEGVTEVTIIYGDASLTIPISSVLITGLDIVKMPSNTTYFVGEVFKADGMVLRYTLDNGEYREISDFSAADVTFDQTPLELGDDSITITYNGYTCEVPITVMGRGFKIEAKKEGENITITDPENAAKPSKEGTNETIKEFASNGDFMQDFSEGCVMTFTFESDTPQVNLLLQASSTYVTEYSEIVTWAPITVEDMQVNFLGGSAAGSGSGIPSLNEFARSAGATLANKATDGISSLTNQAVDKFKSLF